MSRVNNIAKKAAERRLKNPCEYSTIVDVSVTFVPGNVLLDLIKGLSDDAGIVAATDAALRPRIDDFSSQLGYLVAGYKARIKTVGNLPTLRKSRAYAKRLIKYVEAAGTLPDNSQHVPWSVRYDPAVVAGASPLGAVQRYEAAIQEVEGGRGQPKATDKDRLICNTLALTISYGVRPAQARRYTDMVLKASGVMVPKIGDGDGRAMRFIQKRGREHTSVERGKLFNAMAFALVAPRKE